MKEIMMAAVAITIIFVVLFAVALASIVWSRYPHGIPGRKGDKNPGENKPE